MMHPAADIRTLLQPGRRVHLAGIGGVSMCALAEVLQGMGLVVQGSDMTESDTVRHLRSLGIQVAIGHSAENLKDCDAGDPHRRHPRRQSRRSPAPLPGASPCTSGHRPGAPSCRATATPCASSGTHGKTTTTSMATHIFMAAQKDPTVMIGGTLPLLHSGYRVGQGDTIILESCEYCNSFLNFFPTVAVILNVHADHLDFFKDLADIEHSFHQFAELVPAGTGRVVANLDDEGARAAVAGLDRPVFTYSVKDHSADCYADNVAFFDGYGEFDIIIRGQRYAHAALHVPGAHNVSNALAAAAAAYLLGVDGSAVEAGLSTFTGAGRRFEHKGTYHGAEVYDDYAHHPDEVEALLNAVQPLPHKRLICAFQPHTYTRTAALFDDFVRVLRRPDRVVLAEIYAAREKNELGISSRDLAAQIPGAVYCSTLEQVAEELAKLAQPGDMLLTVGAGDIYRAGEMLLERGDAE